MNACGIFNTASGKSVQVSDSALQKARQVFSKSEDKVPSNSFPQCRLKVMSIQTYSEEKDNIMAHVTPNLLSSAFSDLVQQVENTFQFLRVPLRKVMGMFEEFNLIETEYSLQYSPTSSTQDISKILPVSFVLIKELQNTL